MLNRLAALITKELIQFTRDRVLLIFTLVGPVVQMILMGHAISQDIVDIPIGVIDYDLTSLSREIVTALDNTNELVVAYYPDDLDEARQLVDDGTILGYIVIPPNFQRDTLNPAVVPEVQVIIDGNASIIASRTLQAAQGAVQSLVDDALVAANRPPSGIRVFTDALFNRALSFRPDSIASQLGLITFQMSTLVAVMGIVREREIGTIEMLTITPLTRLEMIAGKAITPFIMGSINFLVMLGVTQVVFDLPLRGSFWLLFALTLLYLITEIAYALIVSTLTRTQQQATTMVFVWAMVAMTLSGYLVPITTLPTFLQWISWAVPLRHYLAILRPLILKGATFAHLWPSAVALTVLALVMIVLTTRTLSRLID